MTTNRENNTEGDLVLLEIVPFQHIRRTIRAKTGATRVATATARTEAAMNGYTKGHTAKLPNSFSFSPRPIPLPLSSRFGPGNLR